MPEGLISSSIKRHVDVALGTVEPGKNFALIAIVTKEGTNFATAYRTDSGAMTVGAWFGKSGWHSEPLEGGVFLKVQG
jgi:hypothetical protein